MTKWLTEAELRARWGDTSVDRWGDRDGDGLADSGVVEAAIEQAEARAESELLGTRYVAADLPTTPGAASLPLKEVVGALAPWYLCEAWAAIPVGSPQERAYQDGLYLLRRVAAGGMSLVLSPVAEVDAAVPQVLGSRTADEATFTLDAMKDW